MGTQRSTRVSVACNGSGTLNRMVVGRFVSLYVLWVETIRIRRAEGCGPPDAANVRNDGYHFNTSMNLKLGSSKVAYNFVIH